MKYMYTGAEIGLRHGVLYLFDGAKVATKQILFPTDDEPVRAVLQVQRVDLEVTNQFMLSVGNGFPVGNETWYVKEINDPYTWNYEVVIRRTS